MIGLVIMDPRIKKLAWTVVNYSIQLQIGEYLLVEVEGHHRLGEGNSCRSI